MTPAGWRRVEELFNATVELDAADRDDYLTRECDDPDLRTEVRRLLASEGVAGDSVAQTIASAAVGIADAARRARVGTRLGPYRLVEVVGTGGMGTVYRAQRDDAVYEQTVAVKLIASTLPSEVAAARFRDERQILAGLEHPGIVRLLDGGTFDGVPYLVMEFVRGVPITAYVSSTQLDVKQRVALVRRVCEAVSYAHRRLVVHRDLKPSNVLVREDGEPTLLDFGIAKLLDPSGPCEARTRTGLPLFTPEYASPEQVRGQSASMASDVYGLGAVLYAVLTGQPPITVAADPVETLRRICEAVPASPSQVAPVFRRELAGDLDNIVAKALHKDPGQRYASVEQFADDLDRVSDGRPVLARAPTLRYRARKFASRNWVALAIGSFAVAALATATVVSVNQARRADREASRARARLDEVRALATTLLFDLDTALQDVPGTGPARQRVAEKAGEYLDRVAREGGADARLVLAYVRLGDVQGSPHAPSLGLRDAGMASYDKARDILDRLRLPPAQDARLRRTVELGAATLATSAGHAGAVPALVTAIALARDHDVPALIGAYATLATAQREAGDLRSAASTATAFVAWAERDHPGWSPDDGALAALTARLTRAETWLAAGDVDAACHDDTDVDELRRRSGRATRDARVASLLMQRLELRARCRTGIGRDGPWWPVAAIDLESGVAALSEARAIAAALSLPPLDGAHAAVIGRREPPAALRLLDTAHDWLSRCVRNEMSARVRASGTDDPAPALVAAGAAGSDARLVCDWYIASAAELGGRIDVATQRFAALADALEAQRRREPTRITLYVGLDQVNHRLAAITPLHACGFLKRIRSAWADWPGPDGSYVAAQLALLEDELARCGRAREQHRCDASRPFGAPVALGGIASAVDGLNGGGLSADERTIVFGAAPDGVWDLYLGTRRGLDEPFGRIRRSPGSTRFYEYWPQLSPDGLELYMHVDVDRDQNQAEVWVARRQSERDEFAPAEPLLAPSGHILGGSPYPTDNALYYACGGLCRRPRRRIAASVRLREFDGIFGETPVVARDELTIYFSSSPPSGTGRSDIWMARRSSTGRPFEQPRPVAELSSPARDWPTFVSADGCRLYFESERGDGRQRLYVVSR